MLTPSPSSSQPSQPQGRKYDNGKLRYDLVPVGPLRELVKVYTYGAYKYADENWRGGISFKRIIGAIERHLAWVKAGRDIDDESGLLHAAHAAFGLFCLMEFLHTHPGCDDRVKDCAWEITPEKLTNLPQPSTEPSPHGSSTPPSEGGSSGSGRTSLESYLETWERERNREFGERSRIHM